MDFTSFDSNYLPIHLVRRQNSHLSSAAWISPASFPNASAFSISSSMRLSKVTKREWPSPPSIVGEPDILTAIKGIVAFWFLMKMSTQVGPGGMSRREIDDGWYVGIDNDI